MTDVPNPEPAPTPTPPNPGDPMPVPPTTDVETKPEVTPVERENDVA
jgi:hypothetical protein